jgi:hypothetical protein
MDSGALIYLVVVFAMTSWPIWLMGGVGCVLVWRASTTWHPLGRLLARTFLLALPLTPTYAPACMPGFVPAVLIFVHETPEEWLSLAVMPLFFGWLIILSIPVAIAAFEKIRERPFP